MKLLHALVSLACLLLLLFVAPDTSLHAQVEGNPAEEGMDEDTDADAPAPDPDIELQETTSLLVDHNGDGQISIAAFGDSITRGVGDFISPDSSVDSVTVPPEGEAGYPLRVEQFLSLPVANLGIPGERLTTQGVFIFASEIPARRPDIVIISGGSNDAIDRISVSRFARAIQTTINIADAVGTKAVLATTPPVCCNRSGLQPILDAYEAEWRTRAVVNELPLADVDRAYTNTCNRSNCSLLNRPEGLHPNITGYDVSGEVVTATLLGIDLLEPNGPATLEAMLGLVPGSVTTVPNAPSTMPSS